MRSLCVLAIVAGWLTCAHGDTRYVVPPGTLGVTPTDPYNTGWTQAATNILDAVRVAVAPDTILLSNGVYGLTNQVTLSNGVTMQGFGGPREAVVLNGNGAVRCLSVTHADAVVSGITLSNGYISSGHGGGIYMTNGVVTNCLICNNAVTNGTGGGVYMNSGGRLDDCEIRANRVLYISGWDGGGGVRVVTNGIVTNCLIAWNSAYSTLGGGGGISMYAGGVLIDSRIVSNTALGSSTATEGGRGGGVSCQETQNSLVVNCLIADNIASNGGGILTVNGGIFSNCVISGNSALGQGGNNPRGAGGGIEIGGSTTNGRVFYGCIISNNYASAQGGGVYHIYGYSGKGVPFQYCTIINNRAVCGGGMCLYAFIAPVLNVIIEHCTIKGNTAFNTGAGTTAGAGHGGIAFLCLSARISDCVITDNVSSNGGAGGVYCENSTNVLIANCTVSNNCTVSRGGGICFYDKVVGVISNCIIVNNAILTNLTWPHGGGLYLGVGTGTVCNSLIAGNTSASEALGGGMYISGANSHTIINCTIAGNRAKDGGGVTSAGTNTLVNCVIQSNTASSETTANKDLSLTTGSKAILSYCSTSYTNNCEVTGSSTNDPRFANPAAGNYRLTVDSPCCNTGVNQEWMTGATDLDGVGRVDQFSRRVDMGAYEFLPSGSLFSFH